MTIDAPGRFKGAMLGKMIGDTLGAGVEGMPKEVIEQRYGELRDLLPSRDGEIRYTDDTQMAIALAISIIEHGGVDPKGCADKYAELFQPWRGYGWGASRVLRMLREGADHRETGSKPVRERFLRERRRYADSPRGSRVP